MIKTSFRSGKGVVFGVAACASVFLAVIWLRSLPGEEVEPYPAQRILRTAAIEGIQYKLTDDGNVFRVIDERNTWSWVDRVFDPEQLARDYIKEGEEVFFVDPESGRKYQMLKHFEEGFEDLPVGVAGLRALMTEERKWNEFTLQTPKTPSIADYVALRNTIIKEGGDFLDAVLEPTGEQAHSGNQSLRCFCPPKSASMICAKASIASGFFYFEEGEDLWFQSHFKVDGETRPFTLADIEGRHVKESPGIRLMIFQDGALGAELKSLDKPTFRQAPESKVLFPTDEWVKVTWHVYLHPDDGKIHIWQNDRLIVDAVGPTLPFSKMILNSVEVGISAHSFGNKPSTLFVDDIVVTHSPLRAIPEVK
ncbi:MAG: hypothetical protein SFV81_19770 [Pirellulaceae bacterium]|nr:hypothetical protein [Pirellulaceae bacterium]